MKTSDRCVFASPGYPFRAEAVKTIVNQPDPTVLTYSEANMAQYLA